ncbi:DedA family protein [Streptomyces sp. NPDC050617]|uniref:DedA family protein n=1 Tax=Streptomyces sp. NPDC050617 TaxID=3154628 RepID=UPI00341C5682
MHIDGLLETVPAVAVYLLVGGVIGLESLGIPLPGEIVLVSATLMAATQDHINPYVLGACAVAGAIIGDSIGYLIGRKGGKPLLEWLGRKFPKHFGPKHVATAERQFQKWGMWAVFIGRFIALLRIFAGPLAGVLKMPYWKFLIANVLGGIVWAGGTVAVIYSVGKVAEKWLSSFAWVGLVLALLFGLGSMLVMKKRQKKAEDAEDAEEAAEAEEAAAAKGAPEAATVVD